ncbi:hypothetical protein [uncultured Kordia sp.]|uniref:hypothetical protein n=1 Tax=uncultured Kordia sp. TaxID=507699 RepID=UPI00260561ED|nr:hypothetical protein [uncultured Kordia sp.]
MNNLSLKASVLFVFCLIIGCKDTKFKSEFIYNYPTSIDMSAVQCFLKNPINNSQMYENSYKSKCELSLNQDSLNLTSVLRKYYDCTYFNKGKVIAKINSSVFKTDSTWTLGTNGYKLHYFETSEQTFPLKKELNIGSSIHDFFKLFGKPKRLKNSYIYNYRFQEFSSALVLEFTHEVVTKITITNTMSH